MTEKVMLRAMEMEDLDELYTIENCQELWSVSNRHVFYSRQLLRDFILNTTGDFYQDRQLRLMIINSQNQVMGTLDFTNFEPNASRAEVGIALKAEYRGKGLAQEALTQGIDFARRHLQLHQIYAIIPVGNSQSRSLFSACGFTESGILRQWHRTGFQYEDVILQQLFLEK